jgi:uncharacterized protein YqgV (UPF0045/DUF77 family)
MKTGNKTTKTEIVAKIENVKTVKELALDNSFAELKKAREAMKAFKATRSPTVKVEKNPELKKAREELKAIRLAIKKARGEGKKLAEKIKTLKGVRSVNKNPTRKSEYLKLKLAVATAEVALTKAQIG